MTYYPLPDSAYGDVSGLPDPFHDGSLGLDVVPGGQQQQQHPLQHLSFDDGHHHQQQHQQQHESGYSTPSNRNRRIIREIIV